MNGEEVLLAIDTSQTSSVALRVTTAAGAAFGAVAENGDPRGHAEHIGPLLAEVFSAANVSPERVTGVVAGMGPGPFTGLRIGIAAAQAFALARGVPLLPLTGHESVALEAIRDGREEVRVVQDAKRRELFVTEYRGVDEDGIPVLLAAPRLVAREAFTPEDRDVWAEEGPAELLTELAHLRLAAGRDFEPNRAVYLRAPDVKQPGPVKRVSR